MRTLVFVTRKGGSGKSTLAAGIAVAAQQAGHIVRLIETDSQGTLSNWQRRRPTQGDLVEAIYDPVEIEPRLRTLRWQGTNLAIIDTSGGMNAAARIAIHCADLCLLPTRPSIADLESTRSTLRIINESRRPFAFVLNQSPSRGQRVDMATASLAGGARHELADALAQPFIVSRNDHQDALAVGLAVVEYAPEGKAAVEFVGSCRGSSGGYASRDGCICQENPWTTPAGCGTPAFSKAAECLLARRRSFGRARNHPHRQQSR